MLNYSNYISGKQSHSRLLSSAGRSIIIIEHKVNYSKVQHVNKELPEASPFYYGHNVETCVLHGFHYPHMK